MKLDQAAINLIRNMNSDNAYGDEYSPIPCGPVIDLLLKEIERLKPPILHFPAVPVVEDDPNQLTIEGVLTHVGD